MPQPHVSVIVIGYGPESRTKRAVRRARALADSAGGLSLVPASPVGRRAAAGLSVTMSDEIGTAGIEEMLLKLDPGPVLLIHDDVVLSPVGLHAMVEVLGRLGGFVTPHTNDVGMGHFGGSLPPVAQTTPELLSQRGRHLVEQTVRVVRPVCVLADRDDLGRLCDRPLVDPNVWLDDIDMGFVAAPVAAAHDGECTSRLDSPNIDDGRPLLVAAMIVRDEEDMLPGLLDSIGPLVDRIEICDTGSVDRTIEIAEAAGARVIERQWRNDFGWARNQVLEQCRDAAYVLLVDADDRVECDDPMALRKYLATYYHEYAAFSVEVRGPDGGRNDSSINSVRIARADQVVFSGAVHELAVWADRPDALMRGSQLNLLRIQHLGYIEEVAVGKNKAVRNLEIAKAEFERSREFKTIVEYARSLIGTGGDNRAVVELFREARSLASEAAPPTRAYVTAALANHLVVEGEYEEALHLATEALTLVPRDDMAAGAAARAAERLDRPQVLVDLADHLEGARSPNPVFTVESDRAVYAEAVVVARARVGDLTEAKAGLEAQIRKDRFGRWAEVLNAVADRTPVVDWLRTVVAIDAEAGFLPWVSQNLPPGEVAELCAVHIAAGGSSVAAALHGVVAALIAGHPDLAASMAPSLRLLQPEQVLRLAEEADNLGFADVANILRDVAAPEAVST